MIPRLNNNLNVDTTNPVIGGIATNNQVANPDYNPKTKQGRLQPPTITKLPTTFQGGPGTAYIQSSDKIAGMYSDYGFTPEDVDKYLDENEIAIKYRSREDLDKSIAEKQSALEQTGNFVVQAVGNEILLGSLLGFSNLADFVGNLFTPEGQDDYTNPVSKQIEEWQDSIRKKFEIHRKDPNAAWAVGDWGWWMDNAVSVLSSASMLIPTLGVTKTIGAIGKYTRLGQLAAKGLNKTSHALARGVNSMTKSLTNGDKVGRIQKSISNGTEIAANAFLSRTMENYMEARGVYKEVYDSTLQKVQSPDFNRDEFFKINPDLQGKSDEEIAAHIASVSADETFQNDYAMLMMDIVQFKALKGLWKGKLKNNSGGGISEFNRRAAQNIASETNIAPKVTFRDRLNYIKHNPGKATLKGIGSIEFTEGIEEGYQGIQVEKGKEIAERIFKPNYVTRANTDYLTDDKITEQAFWGVLGGVGFKSIGKGFGKLSTEAKIAYNKKFAKEDKKFTAKQIALMRQGVEHQQIEEILGREARIKKFNEDMLNLDETGTSNIETLKDEHGKDIVDNEGNKIYKELNEEELAQERQDTIDAFITDMTIDSAITGTYDLLREYVKDPNVRKILQESNQDAIIEQQLLDRMDEVYDKFTTNVYNVYNSVDVVNDYIGNKVARDITLDQMRLQDTRNNLSSIENDVNKLAADTGVDMKDVDVYMEEQRRKILDDVYNDKVVNQKGIDYLIQSINNRIANLESEYQKNNISQQAYNKYKTEINKELKAIARYAQEKLNMFTDVNLADVNLKVLSDDINTHLRDNIKVGNPNNVPQSLKKLIDRQVYTEWEIINREESIPITQEEIKDAYELEDLRVNEYTQMAYVLSANTVRAWLREQENLDKAAQELADNSVEELKYAMDILRMGHYTTQEFIGSIAEEIQKERQRRAQEARAEQEVKVDGETVNENDAQRAKETLNGAENTPPSTGEGTQSNTTAPTATDESGQTVQAEVPVNDDNTAKSEIEEQAKKDAEKANQNYDIENDAIAASKANSILMKIIQEDKTIPDILRQGVNTTAYNELLAKVAEELKVQGVTPERALSYAEEGLVQFSNILGKAFKDNYFLNLASQIATKVKNERNFASVTPFVGEKGFNEVIEKFITEYAKLNNIPIEEKGHTLINTKELINYIINHPNINFATAKYIIRNLRDYLASNNSKTFVFDNRNMIYGLKNTVEDIINQAKMARIPDILMMDGVHINFPTNDAERKKAKEALRKYNGKQKLTFRYRRSPDRKYRVKGIDIVLQDGSKNGVIIGYLGETTIDANGTNLRLKSPNSGFVYKLTKVDSNNLNAAPISNLDDFFDKLLSRVPQDNLDKLYNIIDKYNKWIATDRQRSEFKLTEEDYKEIVNNPYIKRLRANRELLVKDSTNQAVATTILDSIYRIVFYNSNLNTPALKKLSFEAWKRKIYENYEHTKYIQELMNSGVEVTADIHQINITNTNYNPSTNNNVGEMGFTYEENPVVYFLNDGTVIDDNGNTYDNPGAFATGSAGILIGKQGNTPIIASIKDTIKVKDSVLAKAAKNEITNIITKFSNGKLSFNQVGKLLAELMGGTIEKHGIGGNHLFAGVNIIQDNERIGIYDNATKKVIAILYKNKKGKNQTGTGITYFNDKYAGGKQSFVVPNERYINEIVNDILANLKFNINYIMPMNRNYSDVNTNTYFGKQNGKFAIYLGGTKLYDTYTQFLIDNKIAITNQNINDDGTLFRNSDIKSVSIDTIRKDDAHLPVEGELTSNRSLNSALKESDITNDNHTPGQSTELLEIAGFSQEEINIITGKKDNIPSLIPDYFLFDPNSPYQGYYNKNTKQTFIGRAGINELNGGKRRALRLLAHERLHALLEEKGVFARENIVNELLDTFEKAVKFADTIDKKNPNYKAAQEFKKFVETFNPKDYIESLEDDAKNSEITPERRFAEEWLVESLTNPGISEFLNIAGSSATKLDQNETLWNKIIKILLKLLGVNTNKVNDFSILAEQINILNKSIAEETTAKVEETTTETKKEKDDATTEKPISRDRRRGGRGFDKLASTTPYIENSLPVNKDLANNPDVNPTKAIIFTNEEEFINRYDKEYRPFIKQMIDNNEIHFICK